MKNFVFELCAETPEAARAGEHGGADRIELCSELALDGVTPHPDLIAATVEAVTIPVHVLIRPRAGNFFYSRAEFVEMQRQIQQARRMGAAGVAVGMLHEDGRVDVERTRELVGLSRPLRATFHRAFDETPDLTEALEAVIETGADCLLTSGGAPNVLSGAEAIAQLCSHAGNRLNIMAGGGLRLNNLVRVLRQTGVSYLHGSFTDRSTMSADPGHIAAALESDVREAVRLHRHEMQLRSGDPVAATSGASIER